MEFAEYAKGISFIATQPDEPAQMLEVFNTRIPCSLPEADPPRAWIADLCAMPRMSTFAIGCLINKAVHDLPDGQCYVNVGVWHGFSLLVGMLRNPDKKCIGIDNFSEFGGPRLEFRKRYLAARSQNHHFYEIDYKKYFEQLHKDLIGFYFYDGAHDYANQIDGLRIAEPFLADNALVMVDDTNWRDPYQATLDFMETSDFNYNVILDEKTSSNFHPTWHNGIMVIQKVNP
jgi:hypothetical protein